MNESPDTHLPHEPNDRLLTVREVARLLKVSTSLIYLLIESRKLASHRIGSPRGSIRIRREDLDHYLQECRVDSDQPAPRPSHSKLKHLRLK